MSTSPGEQLEVIENLIREGKIAKGNPLHTAKIAGVLAAKKTSQLVPLCHPLPLTSVEVEDKAEDTAGFSKRGFRNVGVSKA